MMIDKLIEGIKQTKCPVCVGLDTMHTYLPEDFSIDRRNPLKSAAEGIYEFNKAIIDAVYDIVPSVKVQVAYYEQYGPYGMKAFQKTIAYAKKLGLVAIADVKRNDIGSTAAAYSNAILGGLEMNGELVQPYNADFATVTGYLGTDGVKPFVEDCKKYGKGIFVLVKTSNPSGGEIQDLRVYRRNVYLRMADLVKEWGKDLIGEYGYSSVGAVVGATYKEQAAMLRKKYPEMFFLVPGYGAQGATADDIVVNFDQFGMGAVVNSSRGILLAYRKPQYAGMTFAEAARAATLDMKNDILGAFQRNGIEI